jgi:hypothetical protein
MSNSHTAVNGYHRLLEPTLALFNVNDRPIWKLAWHATTTADNFVELVPGINPSHFDVSLRCHRKTSPLNDPAQQPGPLVRRCTPKRRDAAPVRCSG